MKPIQIGTETIQPTLPRGAMLLQAGVLLDGFGEQAGHGLARFRVLNLCLLGLCLPAPVPPPFGPYKAGEEDAFAAGVLEALQDNASLHAIIEAAHSVRDDLTRFIYGEDEEEKAAEDFSEAGPGAPPDPGSSTASDSAPAISETPSATST